MSSQNRSQSSTGMGTGFVVRPILSNASSSVLEPNRCFSQVHAEFKSKLFVPSFEKGLRILETIGRADHSLSLVEIVQRSGIHKSAAQRFTFTLAALGYLEKNPSTRRYGLGAKVVELGSFLQLSDKSKLAP